LQNHKRDGCLPFPGAKKHLLPWNTLDKFEFQHLYSCGVWIMFIIRLSVLPFEKHANWMSSPFYFISLNTGDTWNPVSSDCFRRFIMLESR
jgi:hypothetical protein